MSISSYDNLGRETPISLCKSGSDCSLVKYFSLTVDDRYLHTLKFSTSVGILTNKRDVVEHVTEQNNVLSG
jgi:hypothetical protein